MDVGVPLGVICALVPSKPNLYGYLQSADRPQGRQRHYLLPASGRASVQLEGD
jgi:hypothetical protein